MSDVSVRAAARRFAASGSVDDEARALRERVRAGRLALERVRACAYLGHAAARAVVGLPDLALVSLAELHQAGPRRDWKRSLRGVRKHDLVAALLDAVELARALAGAGQPGEGAPEPDVDEALSAVRAWLDDPDASRRAWLVQALSGRLTPWWRLELPGGEQRWRLRRTASASIGAALGYPRGSLSAAADALWWAGALCGAWSRIQDTFTRTLITRTLITRT